MKKMILIGGMPAVGKTTIGYELAAKLNLPILDKDKICDLYTNYVVSKETFPNDRSSELYTKILRNIEYDIMFNLGLEQVKCGLSPILVSPFSSEFISKEKLLDYKKRLKSVDPEFNLETILIKGDPEIIQERIIKRNRKEDYVKIKKWLEYIQNKMEFQKIAEQNVEASFFTGDSCLEEILNYLK